MAKLEFFGGLYLNDDNQVIIPTRVLLGTGVAGAKKIKMGPQAKAGIIIDKDAVLEYPGMNGGDIKKLYDDKSHVTQDLVVVQRNRIVRTRPIFNEWSVTIEVEFIPDIIQKERIVDLFDQAGLLCGLGDWRPQYGRFSVEEV